VTFRATKTKELSARQQQLLELILEHRTIQEMTTIMGITNNSIAALKKHVFHKLGVRSVAEVRSLYPKERYCAICRAALDKMDV